MDEVPIESPVPVPILAGASAYSPPRHLAPVDLHLDGNEGAAPSESLLAALQGLGTDLLRRYPDAKPLERALAARFHVDPVRVVVTAGGDDGLERAVRAVVGPGRSLVLPVPSFEMLARFAGLAGGGVIEVPWKAGTPYPTDAVLAAAGPTTGAVAVVSPNNPTGAVATADDVLRIARALPHALILADLAYVEFADQDPTALCLDEPNVAVFRTLSKAWGLAGLRVGYTIAPERVAGWMRITGLPYPVARPSLALAGARIASGEAEVGRFVAEVRRQRECLAGLLDRSGATPFASQANFVLARFADAAWVRDGLAGLGIAVRAFPGTPGLEDCLRITCPGDEASFDRLQRGLQTVLAPEALLFDMDGVLVDVGESYRVAIVVAAAAFGVTVTADDVARAKREPGSNNDWVVTRRLLAGRGVDATLDAVKERFEAAYQGVAAPEREGGGDGFPQETLAGDGAASGVSSDTPGLWTRERLALPREVLARLAARMPLAIVTGRPRADAERFLRHAGVEGLFRAIVCMEDAPAKPDPAPVALALAHLGVTRAWMLGDAPDDVRAARAAGVVPLGVVLPGEDAIEARAALLSAGAARVLVSASEVEEVLP